MKIKTGTMAILTLTLLFGSILATDALGLWRTVSTREPARYVEGEAAGEYNPADIRGSYDLAAVSSQFGIPAEDLMVAFSVPAGTSPADFQLKELETIWAEVSTETLEIGTGSVRLFVAAYKGLPMALEEGTGLPGAAVDIILAKGTPTEEQQAYIQTNRVAELPAGTVVAEDSTTTDAAKEESAPATSSGIVHEETERTVNGSTTWKEVEEWGVSREQMEAVFGKEIKLLTTIIKDDCSKAGLPFSGIKSDLQALVDAAE